MSKEQYKVTNEKYVSRNLHSALCGDFFNEDTGVWSRHGNIGVGENNSMFCTFTFVRKIYQPSEANKYISRFLNSIGKKLKRKGYDLIYFWVVEPHKKGGCHYHVLISCPSKDPLEKPFSTTRFNDLVKATIKKTKMPLGFINQCVWTFTRSYEPVKNMQTGIDRNGVTYWKDRTPKKSEDDVKGVVSYLVKYLVKSLGYFSDIGVKSRSYGFSNNFPLQIGRDFTDIDNGYFRRKFLYLDQIKRFYFPKTFEIFYWYRYTNLKELDDNGKEYVDKGTLKLHRRHLSDIREIYDRYIEKCSSLSSCSFYDDEMRSFFYSCYDLMKEYSFIKKSDLESDRVNFDEHLFRNLKNKFISLFPSVYENLDKSKRISFVSEFGACSLADFKNDGSKFLNKIKHFAMAFKGSVPVEVIKADLTLIRDEYYLKDVPF